MDYLPMNPASSNKLWYIVGGTAIVVGAVLLVRSYYTEPQTVPTAIQTQTAPAATSNTVADITTDFNQTSDLSAELTADKAVSAQAVSAF